MARSAASWFNWKTCREPGIHAPGDIVDMAITQISQRLCCNVAPMTGLAIDDQMVIERGSNVSMPNLNFLEVDVQIGSRNES